MESALDKYLREHSSAQDDALLWIQKQTNMYTNYPRMMSGPVQGALLKILTEISGARRVLEIGTYTGYSAVCIASGLPADGRLDTLELNDEMEDLILEGFRRAGLSDRISLHIGDAKESLASLHGPYDMVFIDADKREYLKYYEAVFDKVRPGGLIVADDVLWDGKVYEENVPTDSQTAGITAFNDAVAADPRVENVIIPLRDGLNVIRKK